MIIVRQFLLVASVTGIAVFATAAGAADADRTKNASGPGCMWLAKRVMLALLRDDIVAANDYQDMYKSFVCPAVRLADAFSCVVSEGAPESAGETREKIDTCWEDPRQTQTSSGSPGAPEKAVKMAPPPRPAPSEGKASGSTAKPPAASSKSAPPPAAARQPLVPPLSDKHPPYVK